MIKIWLCSVQWCLLPLLKSEKTTLTIQPTFFFFFSSKQQEYTTIEFMQSRKPALYGLFTTVLLSWKIFSTILPFKTIWPSQGRIYYAIRPRLGWIMRGQIFFNNGLVSKQGLVEYQPMIGYQDIWKIYIHNSVNDWIHSVFSHWLNTNVFFNQIGPEIGAWSSLVEPLNQLSWKLLEN